MADQAIELHRRIRGNINLNSFIDDLLSRLEVFNIYRASGDKLFPGFIAAMTKEAFISLGLQVHGAVGMAVDAGESFHPYSMNFLVGMAFHAEPWLGHELVRDKPVAFGTLDLLNEYVFGMERGVVYLGCFRIVAVFVPVALYAYFPCNKNSAVPRRHGFLPEYSELVHLYYLVLLC